MDTSTKLQIISTVTAGLFSGAALYINLVEHPARLSCGVEVAHAEFVPSYKRAAKLQAFLAAISLSTSLFNYLKFNKCKKLLAGSLLIGSVIPFTFAAIMPTNKILLARNSNQQQQETQSLLEKWGKLHAVRTVASLVAFGLFVCLLAKNKK